MEVLGKMRHEVRWPFRRVNREPVHMVASVTASLCGIKWEEKAFTVTGDMPRVTCKECLYLMDR